MTIEDRFYAAVNVIGGLPKHGPYQPSNEMKLSFYAYYKQATEGANKETKPWSWEVVKKAKWDAWKRLGDMTREEAMKRYVEELNKIVETMSYTENVADFLKSMDEFNSQDTDKETAAAQNERYVKSGTPGASSSNRQSPIKLSLTTKDDSVDEDDDEFFTDSIETAAINKYFKDQDSMVIANGRLKQDCYSEQQQEEYTTDILMRTVLTMRTELNEITSSLRKIEQRHKAVTRRNGLFKGFSKQTIVFVIVWPIAANLILFWLYHRKRSYSSN